MIDIPNNMYISRPYQVAQNKAAWRAQTSSTPSWHAFSLLVLLLLLVLLFLFLF